MRELVDLLLLRNISKEGMGMLGMELTGVYGRRSMLREYISMAGDVGGMASE